MRFIFLSLLFFMHLLAKEYCYSVVLQSILDTSDNHIKLENSSFSSTCKIMTIGSMLAVRCGCYETLKEAKKELQIQKNSFSHAIIAKTNRALFEDDAVEETVENNQTFTPRQLHIISPNREVPKGVVIVAGPSKTIEEESLVKNSEVPLELQAEEVEKPQHIDLTLLGRAMSNKTFFTHSPYLFALFESDYTVGNWKLSGGVFAQSDLPNETSPLNHLYLDYFGDRFHLKIGKMVDKIGVLDYFSTLNTFNPIRPEFFDDSNMNIKNIPLWMMHADYYLEDFFKLSLYLQPFDASHEDYSGYYVNYMLNQFIPKHYSSFFNSQPLGKNIFSPVYSNYVSPFLAEDINSKRPVSNMADINKFSIGVGAEYSDDTKKVGFVYFNRYTEIPLIQVNQNLVDAAIAYENHQSTFPSLGSYITSLNYDPITGTQGFRYQQIGLYEETKAGSFGLRGELAYRDNIPLLNNFGSVASAGFAIDRNTPFAYYALETQYLNVNRYNMNLLMSMFTTRFIPSSLWMFQWHFENRVIAERMPISEDIAINPRLVFNYGDTDLIIEGMAAKNNTEANSFSFLIRSSF